MYRMSIIWTAYRLYVLNVRREFPQHCILPRLSYAGVKFYGTQKDIAITSIIFAEYGVFVSNMDYMYVGEPPNIASGHDNRTMP